MATAVSKICIKLSRIKGMYSIRFKLITAFFIMIIPIFLLGFVSQNLTSTAIEKLVMLSTSETIEQSAKLIDMLLLNVKDEYIKILASSQIQDYYNFESSDADNISRGIKSSLKNKANTYLTNRVFSSTVISNIWIVAGQNNSLGTRFLPLQFDFTKAGYIGWYKNSFDIKSRLKFIGYHSELDSQGSSKSYAMALTGSIKRILETSFINKSVGVMVIDIDMEFIKKILSDIDLGRNGEVHLVSPDGRDVSAGSNMVKTDVSSVIPLVGSISEANDSGSRVVVYNNENYRFTYKRIGNTGLIILGLQPESEILSAARSINLWTVILILFAIGTAIVLGLILTFGIGARISTFSKKMERVARGNLNINMPTTGNDEIAVLGEGFNRMIGQLQQYIYESVENEKIKREMAINLLISQINPHLIYNTLNSVIYLAKENRNKDIVKMVESFINLLHNSIKIGDEGLFATIEQEVDSIKEYAVIQHYRYPDKFTIEWDIDEDLFDFKVPKTIIQPLVENALFHGICPVDGQGVIHISIKRIDEYVRIVVEDNGEGMNPQVLKNIFDGSTDVGDIHNVRSMGLSNIRDRIRYFYDRNGDMKIDSTLHRGTKVELLIPVQTS